MHLPDEDRTIAGLTVFAPIDVQMLKASAGVTVIDLTLCSLGVLTALPVVLRLAEYRA